MEVYYTKKEYNDLKTQCDRKVKSLEKKIKALEKRISDNVTEK